MRLKLWLRRLVPRPVLWWYHWLASWAVALLFGLPARGLVVIGVTGTKGKSTTCCMLWHILQQTGQQTGLISTAQFAIGQETWLNDLKMTMPGRVKLQRLLRRMVRAGCTHLVLETSSEGLAQSRQAGIPYQVAVFTNLAPEHLESHGSYEAYRRAKGSLFAGLGQGGRRPTASVINLDDKEAAYFLNFPAGQSIGYTTENKIRSGLSRILSATGLVLVAQQSSFTLNHEYQVALPLGGQFNVANALASLAAAEACGVEMAAARQALASFAGAPGRLEFVRAGQAFDVVVDYAHTPESLEALYQTLAPAAHQRGGRLLAVLGSCGGGRDKAKRELLGRLAGRYADLVWVTNEDPYDEDPMIIMQAVARGVKAVGKHEQIDMWVVPDRREAIKQALQQAKSNDYVVISGKGSEQWLCVSGEQKIPWDDRQVAKEELEYVNKQ
ncbi:MAG: UDP-N-acetylmuramoyl-L-alanyl-D-glutamate--2,6-diaminopimelate ligase [Candidatus Kerfeldbacteria bacterium]|nr:UDP-N-acetylmuramoyl-L-alanyl-D-glutamate--2,6-diaminopimelate ligase [Candidatus Kerfeldbacteria bacterium]